MKNELNRYVKWKRRTENIVDLCLDPNNIRLDIDNKSQDAIIIDLFVNENAMQVLKSISEHGFFPDELPIIINEKGKNVVIEGNRRVAALKAMLSPSLAGKHEFKVKTIMKKVEPIKTIEVVMAPDRVSVDKLLANKHTEVTRRAWKPLRQAYFYHAQIERGRTIEDLKKDYPNVEIVKFIKMWEMHKVARSIDYGSLLTAEKVNNQRGFPVSTLERLYDDRAFREYAGFEFNQEGLIKVTAQEAGFISLFKKIISDAVAEDIDTRTLGTEDKRKEYYEKLPKPSAGNKSLSSEHFKARRRAQTYERNKLDVSGISFQLPYPAVRRMFEELERINIDDSKGFPNATHDLLRSFLECSLKAFYEKNNIVITKNGEYSFLSDALRTFIENKDGDIARIFGGKYTALKSVAQKISQQDMHEYTTHYMNQVNHNHLIFSDRQTVEKGWEILKPLFMAILGDSTNQTNAKA